MSDDFALTSPDWNNIEAVCIDTAPRLEKQRKVRFKTNAGELTLELFPWGMRLKSAASKNLNNENVAQDHSAQDSYNYGFLLAQPQSDEVELQCFEHSCLIKSTTLSVTLDYAPFSFCLNNSLGKTVCRSSTDGHFVRQHRVPPLAKVDAGWLLATDLKSNEAVYGLGEKWGALNKRGQLVRSWNSDALGVNAEVSYKNNPFAWSPEGWGVFSHTPAPVTHAVGYPSWSQRSYVSLIEDPHLDVFLFVATEADNKAHSLIKTYTDLTGSAPVPPNWSGGVILSKAYYQDPEELLSAAKEVRRRGMPCDVITIDGRAWQDTATRFAFEWDKSRWPDPKSVLNELKTLGFKICIWEYPLISVEHDLYKHFDEQGWFLKDKRTGETYQYDWDQQAFGEVLSPLPKSGIVDFTHPKANQYWLEAHKDLFEIGIDMIKADFGEQLEDDNMIAFNGDTGYTLHNAYAFLYNRCVYDAAKQYSQNGPFLFSRAAWIGSQRFNSQWGGDPQADWEGMMANIRGGLSWGLSGAPFYATDVGGFYKDTRDDKLYVRWAQAAIFSAHYRLHGIGAREPWSYSSEACNAVMKALSLRYRLQAYLQKVMRVAAETSLPAQRAMVLAFPEEKQSWAFENQFMFGDDLLVAPCFSASGEVEFYLPQGDWLLFDLDKKPEQIFSGGQVHRLILELDEMAVFVRCGTSIPLNAAALKIPDIPQNQDGDFIVSDTWPATE